MYISLRYEAEPFNECSCAYHVQYIQVPGAISLKRSGGKLASELVCFYTEKELLNFSETAPWNGRSSV